MDHQEQTNPTTPSPPPATTPSPSTPSTAPAATPATTSVTTPSTTTPTPPPNLPTSSSPPPPGPPAATPPPPEKTKPERPKSKPLAKVVAGISMLIALVSLLALGLVLLLSRPPENVSTVASPLVVEASIKTDRAVIGVDISQTTEGALTIGVTQPFALRGFRMSYTGTDIILQFRGLQLSLNEDRFLSQLVTQGIVRAVNASTDETGVSMEARNGVLTVRATLPDGSFTLRVDREKGSRIQLSTSTLELESSFGNFLFAYQERLAEGETP